VFSVTVFTVLLGSGFQRRTFPFLWVPELSLASPTSFCNSELTTSESELLYDFRFTVKFVLAPSPLRITTRDFFTPRCHAYNISAWTPQKIPFLCSSLMAVAWLLVLRSLPSNGSICHNSISSHAWCLTPDRCIRWSQLFAVSSRLKWHSS
jgi:hypothetical protein